MDVSEESKDHGQELCSRDIEEIWKVSRRGGCEGKAKGIPKTPGARKMFLHDFFVKKGISWIKVSKPGDNPFAERGIRTIRHEYLNQVWIGNFSEFEKLSKIIKSHYNEYRPHQSFDNKTPAEVRIAATGNNQEYSPPGELEK